MNRPADPTAIDLAREPDFALGAVHVRPALRLFADQSVEPRVMQALIALARRNGDVVPRAELIDACWAGRAVSEDAINRALSKVGKLGAESEAFTLETIARVGYKLVVKATATTQAAVLAVLAFDNLSPDPDMAFFADGLSDEILQLVARTTPLKVIARASSFQFRGADKAISNVVSQLGATHVLDGSVRRVGDRVRVSAQLIEARSQTMLWSRQFNEAATDVTALQEQIAVAVASMLNARFQPVASGRIDPAAHDLFMRARELANLEPGSRVALRMVDEVTMAAPDYAPAWAIACFLRLAWRRFETDRDLARRLYDEARVRAERAYALDPTNPMAIVALENVGPRCGQWAQRIERLRTVATQVSGNISPDGALALVLWCVGRMREALPYCHDVFERQPLWAGAANDYALNLLGVGRHEEGLALLERTCRRRPGEIIPWGNLVMNAARLQRWDLVDHWLAPERRGAFSNAAGSVREAQWVADLHRDPSAERLWRMLDGLRTSIERDGRIRLTVFQMASGFCDLDELFDIGERASFAHLFSAADGDYFLADHASVMSLFTPFAKRLRDDPRFVRLCARLGLIDYWIETGDWPDCADQAPYDFRAEARRAHAARASGVSVG